MLHPDYMPKTQEFNAKTPQAQAKICEALQMIEAFGIPLGNVTERRKETMALTFLAVSDVKPDTPWSAAKDAASGHGLTTRGVITWFNAAYGESLSSGTYDTVKRHDLKYVLPAGVVVTTNPNAAPNDSTRSYALAVPYAALVRAWGTPAFEDALVAHIASSGTTLAERLSPTREISTTAVHLPSGVEIPLAPGAHNQLQRLIIEEFLPRFGHNAEVLYLGDATNRSLLVQKDKLDAIGFFQLEHGELPDVVAYSTEKNWVFLIEAVDTWGPISQTRKLKFEEHLKNCTAAPVFVSAFHTLKKFKKFAADLAWEQEVWIAEDPTHMIHFNGDKFLGPHNR